MLSNKPFDRSKEIPETEQQKIIAENPESFAELVTFVNIVPDSFDLGFVESNFAKDRDAIIQVLICHPDCQDIQWQILDFPDPNLRFLLEEILQVFVMVEIQPDKKLILIVRGLEHSIGMTGNYPPMLVDLNWVRDAYPRKVPHPVIFFLPDYAITRVANFAPDLWAWNAGTFVFKSSQTTIDDAVSRTLEASKEITNCEVPQKQERIDLLERLLMEYSPTNSHRETTGDLKTCIRILNELGVAYRSRGEPSKAKKFLEQALELAKTDDNLASLKANALYQLGWIQDDWGNKEEAIELFQQSLELDEKIGNLQGKAASLHQLAGIYANRGEVELAIELYQQSLELKEKIGNLQGKAASFVMLGQLLADKKGDFETALNYLQQSLAIFQHLRSPDAETVREIIARIQSVKNG